MRLLGAAFGLQALLCSGLCFSTASVEAQWQSLNGGVNLFTRSFGLSPDSTSLLIGGNFKYVRQGADSLLAGGLARWDGAQWSIGDLAPPNPDSSAWANRYVVSICELPDTVMTSHGSTNWPGQPELSVAASLYDNAWHPFGEPDLMLDFRKVNGRLFVGGEAGTVFGTYMPGVREWKNGALAQLPGSPYTSNVDVFAFAYWHGQYYFGGADNGELGSHSIHAFDGVDAWSGVDGGIPTGSVRSIAGLGDSLYVGGYFFPGGNTLSMHLQIFDGTQWRPSFPQVEFIGYVADIQSYQGAVYISGIYHFIGESTWYGLLRYDGHELCAIGGPMPSGDNGKIAFFQNNLYMALASTFPGLEFEWVGYLPLDGLVPDTCITISQTSVQERERAVLQVYPNPASNTLTVTFGNGQVLQEIYVLDMTGRIVYRTSAIGARSIQLDVASYPTGVYSIMAIGSGYSSSCRFIKD